MVMPGFVFKKDDNEQAYRAGQYIFKEGSPGEHMYAVKEGEVEILREGSVIETVRAGGIFGEMALIDKSPRSATAVAKTDCVVIPANEKRFLYMIQDSPHFALQVLGVMAGRLRRQT